MSALASHPVWSSVLFHPQFSPSLEIGGCPLSGNLEFRVCLLWIWSSEVVRPGHSFLGMCDAVWSCSCGCFPIPVSPQGQERVGSARNVGVSTQERLCRDVHGQNPRKCFASVGTVGARLQSQFRSLQSVLLWSDPGSSCPGFVFGIRRFLSQLRALERGIGQSLRMTAPSKPS